MTNPQSGTRKALLVGSLPYADERDAMTRALSLFGDKLMALPDGEIGEKSEAYPCGFRAAWVQTIMDRCEENTDAWRIEKKGTRNLETGFFTDYDTGTILRPKFPASKMHNHIDTGWLDYFKTSYPIFKELRQEHNLPDLKFQVGLPTGLGVTFGMLGPNYGLRYAQAFNKRLAWEANEMLKIADPDDLVFQLEVPGELKFAYMAPKILTGFALRTVMGLINRIELKAEFGIHFSFGDFNNKALIAGVTLDRMVHFSNQLVKKWPSTHKLAYLHYPLAEAADPPPLNADYYAPLKDLQIPAGVRFVGGFVHDKRNDAEHRQIMEFLSGLRPEVIDVGCSCGLGRRTADIADQLNARTKELVS
jgi:hypothetical protein